MTSASKSGSAVRIDWKKAAPSEYRMYFHCKTNLVETFGTLFPKDFVFEGNRAIVFQQSDRVPIDALSLCIAASLTYHLAAWQSAKSRVAEPVCTAQFPARSRRGPEKHQV